MSDIAPIPQRKVIPIRLSDGERATLQRLADAWGVSLAAAIRRLIRETAKP
jgi:hypothetical protein